MVSILMAVFIFSFNSIVRQRNIQAHHLMVGEKANYLAISGLRLLVEKLGDSYETTLKTSCPDLFLKTASEIGTSIDITSSNPICSSIKNDFQNFLNTLDELKEPGIMGGYPVCENMDIRLENIHDLTPDTTAAQLQAGRDPVEKCGQIVVRCAISYRGLKRQATLTKQFRVVSMVPGAFCRFSLFVKKTPYPDSYNSMGIKFDGSVDTSYTHPPASNKTFTAPLTIFNGTDTAVIANDVAPRTEVDDKQNLRDRGWIFLGPAGSAADEAVFIKIPSGFNPLTGGHFMLGWPSLSAMPVLAPEEINDNVNFAPASDFPEHEYTLGAKYQGFYTWEEGNPYGAGGKNLWPNLTAGPTFVPSDHIRSASTWIYPFGNQANESRTLVIGPVLAGFLKFFFIRGKNTSTGDEYKGLWSGMSSSLFDSKIATNQSLQAFAGLWSGTLSPEIKGVDFFKNGYSSFKQLMPYNSLPDPSPPIPSNGISINILFDFMKYNRSNYPDIFSAPGIAATGYDAQKFLVPRAEEMRTCAVKGIHPYDEMGIYFKENGQYDPNTSPDNCYFYGDLSAITIFNSNLFSNRITHKLDLKSCANTAEEQSAIEKFLFKVSGSGASAVNETAKTGIFLIKRRAGITENYADALILSNRLIKLVEPQIIIIDRGSLIIKNDIIGDMVDGAPACLFSIALMKGHFFIDGSGFSRKIHAYLASLHPNSGRLLRPPTVTISSPGHFEIHGGLALTEIGLYEDPMADPLNHLGTTMRHFLNGGEVHYNPRFNPSGTAYSDSRVFVIEDTSGKFTLDGAAL
ncbi:MAG: hypothetical protein Kow0029_31270 [Candidatus Rifleibacteriota bacterium]